uniref:Uncharacterized protein n=1 Tax=Anguilla anguilla TaxID=7936 RepID=A0A0E9PW18_ANGAN
MIFHDHCNFFKCRQYLSSKERLAYLILMYHRSTCGHVPV